MLSLSAFAEQNTNGSNVNKCVFLLYFLLEFSFKDQK